MRTFSSSVQTVLNSDNIQFFFLIKLSFASTYYLTSLSSDVVYDGNTYISDGGLYEFDSPSFSTVVDRESYKIVIADQVDTMLNEFRFGVVGKDIEVSVGFIDASGAPLTDLGDVIAIYKGYVDSPSTTNDFQEKLALIEGTSPMADLDGVNDFLSSRDGMDQRSALDVSFDNIFKGNEIEVKWGKV